MNRIERRVAGSGGPRPGAAVCTPGQSNQRQGMLGGGTLFQRRFNPQTRASNISQNRVVQSNNLPSLNQLKMEGDKINRLEQKIEDVEAHAIVNLSDFENRLRMQEDKIRLMTDTYSKTMASMKEYIKSLKSKITELESSNNQELEKAKITVVAKKVEKNKVTLDVKELETQ